MSCALTGTEKILTELKTHPLKDKIIILKLKGVLERGKTSDLNFKKIEKFIREQEAFVLLKNTTKLQSREAEISIEFNSENMEEEIISNFQSENPNKFNFLIQRLISVLQLEKKEDEKSQIFEDRLMSEVRKVIEV